MTDRDIERWTAEWRAGSPPVADLAQMARRESRQIGAWIALDWIFGAGLLAFAAWLWFDDGSTVMRFAAAGIAVLTVVALAFSVINWRGSFASNRASATDFLALALARSRARLRYIRFGGWLLAADVVVIAGAALLEFRDEGFGRLPGMLGTATLVTLAVAVVLFAWRRRERRRAERLAAMQRAMQPETESPDE